jgi:hypothetical protein
VRPAALFAAALGPAKADVAFEVNPVLHDVAKT